MLKEKIFFHPSINIRFDLGRGEFFERYLPTFSHSESLKGLLKGFLNEGSHAHIIVGPYGSGKSLLATLLGGIVSKSIPKDLQNKLIQRFETVDDNIYISLSRVYNLETKYIPVVLNGNQGNFRRNLMISLYRTLQEYGLDLSLPSIVLEILKIIDIWKTEFISTYNEFLLKLKERRWEYNDWLKDIKSFDIHAIEWFKSIYPQLTSGSRLSLAYDKDMVNQLNFVLKELHGRSLGIFLIYDEFGRFLQSLSSTETHETMHDLQDLAEMANHSEFRNLHVLLISHRNMRQYALKFQNDELQKEFKKIEERFNVYYTRTDHSTFVRLASLITEEYRKQTTFKEYVKELRIFNLFPELNHSEIDTLVIKGSYPIHPVTLCLMTHLANLVAQNERTLFTFLENDEPYSLPHYYAEHRDWYRIDTLFDYFEPAISEFEKDSLIGQYYLLYCRLQRKLISSDFREDALKILKLLTLWNITNLHSIQLPNAELISFAFSWNLEKVEQIIRLLHEKKVIRFNHRDEYWDLFEGSNVDVDLEIQKRQENLTLSKRQRMEVLGSVLNNRYVLSKRYNDEKSMTRFAYIHPVYISELMNNEVTAEELKLDKKSDAAILYVLDDIGQSDFVKDFIIEHSKMEEHTIYAIPLVPIEINDQIEKLVIVKMLQQDKYFLSEDPYISDELDKIHTDLIFSINRLMEPITKYQDSLWFSRGELLYIHSDMDLSEQLSRMMENVYYDTPEFRNEAFNRRNITKVQKNAAIGVVNKILQSSGEADIQIQGFGPDYLIYATVIKNNGINLKNPDLTKNPSILRLRQSLLNVLNKKNGKLVELLNIFINKPFGIREPLIPLLLVSLLKNEWKYIMFYNSGIYTSKVDGELLYYMIEHPENYTFSFYPFEKKYQEIIHNIEQVFSEFVETADRSLHPAVYANQILLKWLRSLPRIAQNTNMMPEEVVTFKQLIRSGEIEPDEALKKLYKLSTKDKRNVSQFLSQVKQVCEQFYFIHGEKICTNIYNSTNIDSYQELKQWANNQTSVVKANNLLIKSILMSTEENWVDNLCEKIIGVKRENWSDATDQIFMTQLNHYLNKLTDESFHSSYLEVRIGEEILAVPQVELSEKSQLILNNLKEDIKSMSRTVPKEEIQSLLLRLLKEFLHDAS